MVVAVSVGFVLAAILFMRRMAELTESRIQLDATEEGGAVALPPGAVLYEINGPLFFGAARKAMRTLQLQQSKGFRLLIVALGRVPIIDATGFIALEGGIATVLRGKHPVILAGPLPRPREIFDKANLAAKHPGLHVVEDLDAAVRLARTLITADPRPTSSAA